MLITSLSLLYLLTHFSRLSLTPLPLSLFSFLLLSSLSHTSLFSLFSLSLLSLLSLSLSLLSLSALSLSFLLFYILIPSLTLFSLSSFFFLSFSPLTLPLLMCNWLSSISRKVELLKKLFSKLWFFGGRNIWNLKFGKLRLFLFRRRLLQNGGSLHLHLHVVRNETM
jgi:hypothetical protein